MAELKVLEKKKKELDKMVNARRDQENALRDRIRKAEEVKANAETSMREAAVADDMIQYKAAKENRESAQDLSDFCRGRLSALDVPFDADICNAAINAVEKEYKEIEHDANVKLAGLLDAMLETCENLLSARDQKNGFRNWVKKDLLREQRGLELSGELQEIQQFKSVLKARRDFSLFYKDGKR